MNKIYQSIGLMSGTSMDGIDLALIASDGKKNISRKNFAYQPYAADFKDRLRDLIQHSCSLEKIKIIENELTALHANLVNQFLAQNKIDKKEIDLIGFHGHTILHLPEQKITWQIGNCHALAKQTGINVIGDFRTKDIALGGQGAPLVPIYHFHLFAQQKKPIAVLNIGGISNISYWNSDNENDLQAFDICFGNAPFDDLVKKNFGRDFDEGGKIAQSGKVDFVLAKSVLENEIFYKKPPKSFDRDDFAEVLLPITSQLKIADALASLAYIFAKAIAINLELLGQKPQEIFVCGGGRKNLALMDEMKKQLNEVAIKTAEEIGLNGDSIEAEAFAFLAIRSHLQLPIAFEKTTGAYQD
jgi:anhydro-N-acetylmuramic acid kinase